MKKNNISLYSDDDKDHLHHLLSGPGTEPPVPSPNSPHHRPSGADGQMFYFLFDEDLEVYQSLMEAAVVGTPPLQTARAARLMPGCQQLTSPLTWPTGGTARQFDDLHLLVQGERHPDRAGILVIGPPHEENQPMRKTTALPASVFSP